MGKMSDPSRQEKYEAQTREQFEALGRFVQAFELMVFAIRSGIEGRLQQESQNMVYFTRMIFHHRALTAGPLWELFRGIVFTDVSELRPVSPSDSGAFHDALSKIGKQIEALIKSRNSILHGTPFIGWASAEQEDFSELTIVKWGVSSKGWKETVTPKSVNDLGILVDRCKRVEEAVRLIGVAASMLLEQGRGDFLKRSLMALDPKAA